MSSSKTALRAVKEANEALKGGDIGAALEFCNTALAEDPKVDLTLV